MRRASRAISAAFLAAAALVVASEPAPAQSFFSFWNDAPRQYRPPANIQRRDRRDAAKPRAAATARPTPDRQSRVAGASHVVNKTANRGSALVAVVSIKSQSITVWDDSGAVLRSRVSTGQSGHETPTGLFSIIQRNRHHESNIYSGAPMPWMQRITWSGIALHGGVVPNYPASHGCIRLPFDVAPKLWSLGRIGMRVVVSPSDTRMEMIDNDALPQPKQLSAADVAVLLLHTARGLDVGADNLLVGDAPDRTYDPVEVAALLRKLTARMVDASRIAAREALAASVEASAAANAAIAERVAATEAVAAAEIEARAQAQTADADFKDQVALAAAKIAADERLGQARQRLRAARSVEATLDPVAFERAIAARQAQELADAAPEIHREAVRRAEPLSIFVSRREGRVFLRQGFEQVMDADVEIVEPLDPLGTHTFTAMAATKASGETAERLKWSAVTMPSAEPQPSALEALARIKLPQRVREAIEDRVWTGASLIVSDQGISNETGRGTDFVVLTK